MFKRTLIKRSGGVIRVSAELHDRLIISRIYLTNDIREVFLKLEKEFRQ